MAIQSIMEGDSYQGRATETVKPELTLKQSSKLEDISKQSSMTAQIKQETSKELKSAPLKASEMSKLDIYSTDVESKLVEKKLIKDEDKKLIKAIDNANSLLKQHRTNCQFSYYKDTNRVMIKVIDQETKEVIREVPPEDNLKMLEKLREITGIMLDHKM